MLIVLLLLLVSQTAHAGWFTDGEFEYIYEGNSDKATIKFHYDLAATSVTIPETVVYRGKTYHVNKIGELAFWGHKNITSIEIPSCIESIGRQSFESCNSLKTITIPESVKRIDDYAFRYCSSLEEIHLHDKLEMLGTGVFGTSTTNNTKWLNNQPEGDVYLDNYLIRAASNGSSFSIKEGTIGIAGGNFRSYSSIDLTPATATLRFIGNEAFSGFSSLTSIAIPENVERLGRNVFNACTNLADITAGQKFVEIGNYAFDYCKYLTNAEKGVVYLGNAVIGYTGDSNADVTVKDGTTLIADLAFSGAELNSLTLPSSLENLGRACFLSMNVGTLKMPASVKGYYIGYDETWWNYGEVEDCYFTHWLSLNSMSDEGYLPSTQSFAHAVIGNFEIEGEGNFVVSDNCLYNNDKTILFKAATSVDENLVLAESVKYIAYSALSGLTLNNRHLLPEGLEVIGGCAFENSNLQALDIPASVRYIGESCFSNIDNLSYKTNGTVAKGYYFYGTYPPLVGQMAFTGNETPIGNDYIYCLYSCEDHLNPDALEEMKLLLKVDNTLRDELCELPRDEKFEALKAKGTTGGYTMKDLYHVFANFVTETSTFSSSAVNALYGSLNYYRKNYNLTTDLPDRYFTRIPVSSVGYATAYLPYVSVVPEGVEAYEGGEVTTEGEIKLMQLKKVEDFDDEVYTEEEDDPEHPGEKITVTKTRKVAAAENTIAANEGVVIKASEGTYSFDERETDVTPTTGGKFKLPGQACHDIAKPDGDIFTLTKKYATVEHPVTFARYTGNSMRAYASWWEKPASLQAKYIVFMFPEEDLAIETGLHNGSSPFCNQKPGNAPLIFDINGRQLLSKPANGLYIINGKKIFKR